MYSKTCLISSKDRCIEASTPHSIKGLLAAAWSFSYLLQNTAGSLSIFLQPFLTENQFRSQICLKTHTVRKLEDGLKLKTACKDILTYIHMAERTEIVEPSGQLRKSASFPRARSGGGRCGLREGAQGTG